MNENETTRTADIAEILRQAIALMTPNQLASLQGGIAFSPEITHRKAALEMIAELKG